MKRTIRLQIDNREITVVAERHGSALTLEHGGESYTVELLPPEEGAASGGSAPSRGAAATSGVGRGANGGPGKDEAPAHSVVAPAAGAGIVTAPMTGTVKQIVAAVGTSVSEGDLVVMMEAMKMDIEVSAATSGAVQELFVAEGQSIRDGEPLLRIG